MLIFIYSDFQRIGMMKRLKEVGIILLLLSFTLTKVSVKQFKDTHCEYEP